MNNKSVDQTAQMPRLVYDFDVCMQQSQVSCINVNMIALPPIFCKDKSKMLKRTCFCCMLATMTQISLHIQGSSESSQAEGNLPL